jgi:hypothetical protein
VEQPAWALQGDRGIKPRSHTVACACCGSNPFSGLTDVRRATHLDLQGWEAAGGATVSVETTVVKHGTRAARVDGGRLEQSVIIDIAELAGKNTRVEFWANTTEADVVIQLDFGGGDTRQSAPHVGDNSWHRLILTTQVPTDASQVVVQLVSPTGEAVFDLGYLAAGPVHEYDLPSRMTKGPYQLLQQAYNDRPEGPYWPMRHPIPGRILRLVGAGVHDRPDADASVVDVQEHQAHTLATLASAIAFRRLADTATAV